MLLIKKDGKVYEIPDSFVPDKNQEKKRDKANHILISVFILTTLFVILAVIGLFIPNGTVKLFFIVCCAIILIFVLLLLIIEIFVEGYK